MTPSPHHPMPSEPPDWEALARHRAGESAPEEARAVAAWLAEHPEEARLVEALDGIIRETLPPAGSPGHVGPLDVERALAATHRRMEGEGDARGAVVRGMRAPRRTAAARWVTGGLVAAAAVGAIVVGRRDRGRAEGEGAEWRGRVVAAGAMVATDVGVRDSVLLPDGTRVHLAPASRLVVDRGFGGSTRAVTLEGEGWFQVRHDAARPFLVRAAGALVRDVGTAFVVRVEGAVGDTGRGAPRIDSTAPARRVTVAVTEGRVALGALASRDTGIVLAARDRGVVHADGRVVAERARVDERDVAWMAGRLVYRDAPLVLVADDLRRWYGLDLRIEPAIASRRLTATFEGEPPARIVEVIALAIGATAERRGTVVVLRAPVGR